MKKLRLQEHSYLGKLVVFEGVDGSGKTTLCNLAKEYFTSKGYEVLYLKMPSDRVRSISIFNDFDNSKDPKVRNTVNLTNLTVFVTGDRLLTLDTEILPALKSGKIVICDRYCYTGYVRCPDKEICNLSNRFLLPSKVIWAYADEKTLKQRIVSRENEKNNFYDDKGVEEQIKRFAFLAKQNNFEKIDTTSNQEIINKNLYGILDKIIKK